MMRVELERKRYGTKKPRTNNLEGNRSQPTLSNLVSLIQTLMDNAALFKTARPAGQHLGPGSYDLPSTLKNGEIVFVFENNHYISHRRNANYISSWRLQKRSLTQKCMYPILLQAVPSHPIV